MCKLIAVTNRNLCRGDFFRQIQVLAQAGVDKIILREKELSPEEYKGMAEQVLRICQAYGTECILHNFIDVAKELQTERIHLPLPVAMEHQESLEWFKKIGISTHSMEQVRQVEKLREGWEKNEKSILPDFYITVGHIFTTDCKKGIPPRGLEFLHNICENTELPVYAIGGITPNNARSVVESGAAGICLMSWCMNATEKEVYQLKESLKS